jgi:hypothetical protein
MAKERIPSDATVYQEAEAGYAEIGAAVADGSLNLAAQHLPDSPAAFWQRIKRLIEPAADAVSYSAVRQLLAAYDIDADALFSDPHVQYRWLHGLPGGDVSLAVDQKKHPDYAFAVAKPGRSPDVFAPSSAWLLAHLAMAHQGERRFQPRGKLKLSSDRAEMALRELLKDLLPAEHRPASLHDAVQTVPSARAANWRQAARLPKPSTAPIVTRARRAPAAEPAKDVVLAVDHVAEPLKEEQAILLAQKAHRARAAGRAVVYVGAGATLHEAASTPHEQGARLFPAWHAAHGALLSPKVRVPAKITPVDFATHQILMAQEMARLDPPVKHLSACPSVQDYNEEKIWLPTTPAKLSVAPGGGFQPVAAVSGETSLLEQLKQVKAKSNPDRIVTTLCLDVAGETRYITVMLDADWDDDDFNNYDVMVLDPQANAREGDVVTDYVREAVTQAGFSVGRLVCNKDPLTPVDMEASAEAMAVSSLELALACIAADSDDVSDFLGYGDSPDEEQGHLGDCCPKAWENIDYDDWDDDEEDAAIEASSACQLKYAERVRAIRRMPVAERAKLLQPDMLLDGVMMAEPLQCLRIPVRGFNYGGAASEQARTNLERHALRWYLANLYYLAAQGKQVVLTKDDEGRYVIDGAEDDFLQSHDEWLQAEFADFEAFAVEMKTDARRHYADQLAQLDALHKDKPDFYSAFLLGQSSDRECLGAYPGPTRKERVQICALDEADKVRCLDFLPLPQGMGEVVSADCVVDRQFVAVDRSVEALRGDEARARMHLAALAKPDFRFAENLQNAFEAMFPEADYAAFERDLEALLGPELFYRLMNLELRSKSGLPRDWGQLRALMPLWPSELNGLADVVCPDDVSDLTAMRYFQELLPGLVDQCLLARWQRLDDAGTLTDGDELRFLTASQPMTTRAIRLLAERYVAAHDTASHPMGVPTLAAKATASATVRKGKTTGVSMSYGVDALQDNIAEYLRFNPPEHPQQFFILIDGAHFSWVAVDHETRTVIAMDPMGALPLESPLGSRDHFRLAMARLPRTLARLGVSGVSVMAMNERSATGTKGLAPQQGDSEFCGDHCLQALRAVTHMDLAEKVKDLRQVALTERYNQQRHQLALHVAPVASAALPAELQAYCLATDLDAYQEDLQDFVADRLDLAALRAAGEDGEALYQQLLDIYVRNVELGESRELSEGLVAQIALASEYLTIEVPEVDADAEEAVLAKATADKQAAEQAQALILTRAEDLYQRLLASSAGELRVAAHQCRLNGGPKIDASWLQHYFGADHSYERKIARKQVEAYMVAAGINYQRLLPELSRPMPDPATIPENHPCALLLQQARIHALQAVPVPDASPLRAGLPMFSKQAWAAKKATWQQAAQQVAVPPCLLTGRQLLEQLSEDCAAAVVGAPDLDRNVEIAAGLIARRHGVNPRELGVDDSRRLQWGHLIELAQRLNLDLATLFAAELKPDGDFKTAVSAGFSEAAGTQSTLERLLAYSLVAFYQEPVDDEGYRWQGLLAGDALEREIPERVRNRVVVSQLSRDVWLAQLQRLNGSHWPDVLAASGVKPGQQADAVLDLLYQTMNAHLLDALQLLRAGPEQSSAIALWLQCFSLAVQKHGGDVAAMQAEIAKSMEDASVALSAALGADVDADEMDVYIENLQEARDALSVGGAFVPEILPENIRRVVDGKSADEFIRGFLAEQQGIAFDAVDPLDVVSLRNHLVQFANAHQVLLPDAWPQRDDGLDVIAENGTICAVLAAAQAYAEDLLVVAPTAEALEAWEEAAAQPCDVFGYGTFQAASWQDTTFHEVFWREPVSPANQHELDANGATWVALLHDSGIAEGLLRQGDPAQLIRELGDYALSHAISLRELRDSPAVLPFFLQGFLLQKQGVIACLQLEDELNAMHAAIRTDARDVRAVRHAYEGLQDMANAALQHHREGVGGAELALPLNDFIAKQVFEQSELDPAILVVFPEAEQDEALLERLRQAMARYLQDYAILQTDWWQAEDFDMPAELDGAKALVEAACAHARLREQELQTPQLLVDRDLHAYLNPPAVGIQPLQLQAAVYREVAPKIEVTGDYEALVQAFLARDDIQAHCASEPLLKAQLTRLLLGNGVQLETRTYIDLEKLAADGQPLQCLLQLARVLPSGDVLRAEVLALQTALTASGVRRPVTGWNRNAREPYAGFWQNICEQASASGGIVDEEEARALFERLKGLCSTPTDLHKLRIVATDGAATANSNKQRVMAWVKLVHAEMQAQVGVHGPEERVAANKIELQQCGAYWLALFKENSPVAMAQVTAALSALAGQPLTQAEVHEALLARLEAFARRDSGDAIDLAAFRHQAPAEAQSTLVQALVLQLVAEQNAVPDASYKGALDQVYEDLRGEAMQGNWEADEYGHSGDLFKAVTEQLSDVALLRAFPRCARLPAADKVVIADRMREAVNDAVYDGHGREPSDGPALRVATMEAARVTLEERNEKVGALKREAEIAEEMQARMQRKASRGVTLDALDDIEAEFKKRAEKVARSFNPKDKAEQALLRKLFSGHRGMHLSITTVGSVSMMRDNDALIGRYDSGRVECQLEENGDLTISIIPGSMHGPSAMAAALAYQLFERTGEKTADGCPLLKAVPLELSLDASAKKALFGDDKMSDEKCLAELKAAFKDMGYPDVELTMKASKPAPGPAPQPNPGGQPAGTTPLDEWLNDPANKVPQQMKQGLLNPDATAAAMTRSRRFTPEKVSEMVAGLKQQRAALAAMPDAKRPAVIQRLVQQAAELQKDPNALAKLGGTPPTSPGTATM